jgi:hypothetical protein
MGVKSIEAWKLIERPAGEKSVIIALAWCQNDLSGVSWPGLTYLQKFTCHSRSTVQRAIKNLERDGLLRVDRGTGASSSRYRLQLPKDMGGGITVTPPIAQRGPHADTPGVSQCDPGGHHGDTAGGITVTPKKKLNSKDELKLNMTLFPAPLAADDGGGQKSSSSKPSKSKKAKSEADPRHHEITSQWGEPYRSFHGQTYVFSGKDGSALKRFLASARDVTAAQFMERAGKAWAHAKADRFARQCARAATIAGLCDAWNDIVTEMQRPAAGAGTMHDRRPKNRRDERGQLPGEIPTDVTADKIRRIQ